MPDQEQDTSDLPSRLPLNNRGLNESIISLLTRLPASKTKLPGNDHWIWARGNANLTKKPRITRRSNIYQKGH